MKYNPEDGVWKVGEHATGLIELQSVLSKDKYEEQKRALKKFLCQYFSTGDCTAEQGSSISPMGASPKGGKVFKVRWAIPGAGKSGGLRLAIVVYCEKKEVIIAQAFLRKDNPPAAAFTKAASKL